MNPEENLEREYKFDVPEGFELPDLEPVAGPCERLADQRFVTTYFDSDDLSLWSRRVTLRHRAEEGDDGKWTLKIPVQGSGEAGDTGPGGVAGIAGVAGVVDGGAGVAGVAGVVGGGVDGGVARSELTWKAPIDAVPPEARAESGVVGELRTVVTMRAERHRVRLGEWAEIDDDVVTVTSGPRTGLRFRQVEVELIGPADPGVVESVLGLLGQAGATPGGGVKFARAAGLE